MSNTCAICTHRFTVSDPLHGDVDCLELRPDQGGNLPVCLFLFGGGGSGDSLQAMAAPLSAWWGGGVVAPCRVVTAAVAPWGFYLDDRARGMGWETFIVERLLSRIAPADSSPIGVLGISMGGYGALKIALARPQKFAAVAAIAPMIEPSLSAGSVRPRNRYHYPPEVPPALLGPERDAALYAADHPGARAQQHAADIRQSGMGIYIDAGGADALHAHDGAEFLHRLLWRLDIRHEYHLLADADHVGPTLLPRLQAAFSWLGQKLAPTPPALGADEQNWQRYLDDDSAPVPATPLPPTSPLMPRFLRHALRTLRESAATQDATMERVYGVLPSLPD